MIMIDPKSILNDSGVEIEELTSITDNEVTDISELDKPILLKLVDFEKFESIFAEAELVEYEDLENRSDASLVDQEKIGINDVPNNEVDKKINEFNCFDGSRHIPKNGGKWSGELGDSTWIPDADGIPKQSNPENKTWAEILEKYDIESIPFKDGYPDFSEIEVETVEIEDFTDNRDDNFSQADKAAADKWNQEGKDGRTDWKPSEVQQYRKENNLTWHECEDTKTMQLVPSEVHNNIPHSGGISVIKQQNKLSD